MVLVRLRDLNTLYPDVPRSHLRALLAHASGHDTKTFFQELELDEAQEKVLHEGLRRLQEGVPLSRVLGFREFCSLPFYLNEATLDPRPDSETIVEAVLDLYPNKNAPYRILDLGTGSGCLLISLLTEYLKASGVGVDASTRALEAASQNSILNKVSDRTRFIRSHWTSEVEGTFDVIVSNPPYISYAEKETLDETVLRYDPHQALFAEGEGLKAYEDIMEKLFSYLAPEGHAFFEIGLGQESAVRKIAEQMGLQFVKGYRDLQGISRCLSFKAKIGLL